MKIARDRNFFWNDDSLELFFDFLNRKANVRDDSTAQLVVIPVSSDGKCEVMSFPYHKDGYPLSSRRLTDVSASFRSENGRTVFDLSVPWKVLTEGMNASVAFKPAAGAVLGFDAALNGQDIFGAREKQYAIPSAWGNLKLESAGAALPGEFLFSPATERKRSVYLPGKTSAGWSVTGAGRDLPAGRLLSVDQSVLKTSAPLPGSEMELAVELAGFQAEKKEKPFEECSLALVLLFRKRWSESVADERKTGSLERNGGRIEVSSDIAFVGEFPRIPDRFFVGAADRQRDSFGVSGSSRGMEGSLERRSQVPARQSAGRSDRQIRTDQ